MEVWTTEYSTSLGSVALEREPYPVDDYGQDSLSLWVNYSPEMKYCSGLVGAGAG
jgi:hypothetical protein